MVEIDALFDQKTSDSRMGDYSLSFKNLPV